MKTQIKVGDVVKLTEIGRENCMEYWEYDDEDGTYFGEPISCQGRTDCPLFYEGIDSSVIVTGISEEGEVRFSCTEGCCNPDCRLPINELVLVKSGYQWRKL